MTQLHATQPGDPLATIIEPQVHDVLMERRDGQPMTTVPWSVIHHAPDGFDWGYRGSGPADLALNILNAFLPPLDGTDKVQLHTGQASDIAFKLHQAFKESFLLYVPTEGGAISAFRIRVWLEQNARPHTRMPDAYGHSAGDLHDTLPIHRRLQREHSA